METMETMPTGPEKKSSWPGVPSGFVADLVDVLRNRVSHRGDYWGAAFSMGFFICCRRCDKASASRTAASESFPTMSSPATGSKFF